MTVGVSKEVVLGVGEHHHHHPTDVSVCACRQAVSNCTRAEGVSLMVASPMLASQSGQAHHRSQAMVGAEQHETLSSSSFSSLSSSLTSSSSSSLPVHTYRHYHHHHHHHHHHYHYNDNDQDGAHVVHEQQRDPPLHHHHHEHHQPNCTTPQYNIAMRYTKDVKDSTTTLHHHRPQQPSTVRPLCNNISLIRCVRQGRLDEARSLLLSQNYGDLEEQDERRDGTCLHWAASRGQEDLVDLLLTLGARHDTATNCGSTPLHVASDNGHTDVVRLLLKWGADADCQTENGDTPCHLAAYRGHYDVTRCLLCHGADTSLVNSQGRDVTDEAVATRQKRIIKLVKKYQKNNKRATTSDKKTPRDDHTKGVDGHDINTQDSSQGCVSLPVQIDEDSEEPDSLYERWQRITKESSTR